MPTPPRPRFRRIPILEVIVALAVIALLAGVVGLREDAARRQRAVEHLADLVAEVERAAAAHHADTGVYAVERERTAPSARRELSVAQPLEGWDGPYLERPLVEGLSNPYGRVRLMAELSFDSRFVGFDVDGDGAPDRSGDGNALVLWGVPRAVAAELDRELDGESDAESDAEHEPGAWAATGRVVHQAEHRRTIVLLRD